MGWTGRAGIAQDERLTCLLHGRLTNLRLLQAVAGLGPEDSAAAVVLALHAREGEDAVGRLRGSWALAVHDAEDDAVTLTVDHMGAAGLHLHRAGDRTTFATEVHEVLRLVPTRPPPDELVLAHWLASSDPAGGSTAYAGIRSVRAGHRVRLGRGDLHEERYWSPRRPVPTQRSPAELGAHLVEALSVSVGAALGTGGSPALLLSGGLDSGAIAAVARRRCTSDVLPRAYSAAFPDHPEMDERSYVGVVTHTLGLESTILEHRGGSALAGAVAYLRAYELPLVSPNLALWNGLFDRAAAAGVTTMVDGEGGDAVAGIARYLIADRLRAGRPLDATRLLRRLPGAGDHPSSRALLGLGRDLAIRPLVPAALRRPRPRDRAPAWLGPGPAKALSDRREETWERWSGPRWSAQLAWALTDGLDAADIQAHLRHRAAMSGLEASHPFIDPDLLEVVLTFPPESSFDPHLDRPVLRAGLDGLLDDRIRLRTDKTRFTATMGQALTGDDLPAIRRLLAGPGAEVGAYVDLPSVGRQLLDADPARAEGGLVGWCYAVWRLVTAECFLRFQAGRALPGWLTEPGALAPPRNGWSS